MTDLQPMSEVMDALAMPLDTSLLGFIKASQGKQLDERVALLDGFTNETVFRWIQQVNAVHSVSGTTFYDMVYHLYTHTTSDKWTEALRAIASATGRPYESLRKNFNKWLAKNEKELSPEHAERRERALSALEDVGGNDSQIPSEEDGWELDEEEDELDADEVEFLREDATPLIVEDEEEVDEPPQDGKRTPFLVAVEDAARLKGEWIAYKTADLGDNEFAGRAAESAAEKLTSTLESGLSFDEWKTGTIQGYLQSGYDQQTSEKKAEVDWWKRQLKLHNFGEEVLKPEVVKKESKPKAPSKPKTKQAKLERAMEMVREVHQEIHNAGVEAGDRVLLATIASVKHTLSTLETLIKGGDLQVPKHTTPVTSKSAPSDWKPPDI